MRLSTLPEHVGLKKLAAVCFLVRKTPPSPRGSPSPLSRKGALHFGFEFRNWARSTFLENIIKENRRARERARYSQASLKLLSITHPRRLYESR